MFGGLSKKETGFLVEILKNINEGKQNDLISINSIGNEAVVNELNTVISDLNPTCPKFRIRIYNTLKKEGIPLCPLG